MAWHTERAAAWEEWSVNDEKRQQVVRPQGDSHRGGGGDAE